MRITKRLAVVSTIGAVIGGGLLLAPAASATTCAAAANCSTVATFSLTAPGGLSISVPTGDNTTPLALGAGTTAGSLSYSASLGSVSVADQRAALAAAWTTTVSSTAFTTGTATQYETVPTTNIAYLAGAPTAGITGQVGAFTAGNLPSLASAGVAGAWAGTGNNTNTWNPTLTFVLSPAQVAGVYKGTITHSVS